MKVTLTKAKTLYTDNSRFPSLVKENSVVYDSPSSVGPDFIVKFFREKEAIDLQTEENTYLLCLNGAGFPFSYFHLSIGSINSSICDSKSIFTKALLCGAVSIILIHNHPSKNLVPSKPDRLVAERIKSCGELLGVSLLDFIIVGGESFYSFKEKGEFFIR